jgi:hypothetical protein
VKPSENIEPYQLELQNIYFEIYDHESIHFEAL